MSSSLNQLRRAELTATCRLTAFPCLWQSSHQVPIRRSARISGLSPGTFVHRQAPQADICAPETVAPAYNAHRLSWVPAALVQFVFASPARPQPICPLRHLRAPRRQAKDALNYHIFIRRSEVQLLPEARATFSEIYEKISAISETRWAIMVRRLKATGFRGLE
jgi:hypothetical protein